MHNDPATVVDHLFDLLGGEPGREQYGEGVTQLEHALQCAKFATDAGANEEAIVAALLHDIGHLCAPEAEKMADVGTVDHEEIGADYLRELGFSDTVAQLVAAHVAAKRYLVATNSEYAARLSDASATTLRFQGGPMSPEEITAFEADPLMGEKLRMRAWDEMGKEVDMVCPPLESYREMVVRHLEGKIRIEKDEIEDERLGCLSRPHQ